MGEGSFDKVLDQNFPPLFTVQTTPLTKIPPIFTFPYFSIYTLNKCFPKGEKSKIKGKLESEIEGNQRPKLGNFDFDSRFGGRSH